MSTLLESLDAAPLCLSAKEAHLNQLLDRAEISRTLHTALRRTLHLAQAIRVAAHEVERFRDQLAMNPLHAFEWSDGPLEAAGKVSVFARAFTLLYAHIEACAAPEPEEDAEGRLVLIFNFIQAEAMRGVLMRTSFGNGGGSAMAEASKAAANKALLDAISGGTLAGYHVAPEALAPVLPWPQPEREEEAA